MLLLLLLLLLVVVVVVVVVVVLLLLSFPFMDSKAEALEDKTNFSNGPLACGADDNISAIK